MPTWCNQLSIYDMDTCSSMRVRALQSRREPCSECVLCCAFHVHVGLAGAGSCGAGVFRAHRRASVRSRVCVCVCVCVCMGVRVCVCARTWRARVCEMGCTCVGSRCGSSSHRRSHGTQEWHLFRLAALHGAFDGVHFVHVLAHAYVHAKWQRALLHTVAYDASCVAFFEAYFVRHDVNIRPFAF